MFLRFYFLLFLNLRNNIKEPGKEQKVDQEKNREKGLTKNGKTKDFKNKTRQE